mgnify:CR=1 FL=1
MALETKERQIGDRGYTYHVTELPAKKGRALLVRLIKTLGPVFGQLVSDMKPADPKVKAGALSAINGQSISRALSELAGRLTEADLEHVCQVLGEHSEVSDEENPDHRKKLTPGAQEFHFAGRYLEMFEWIGFALEVNFSDFFSGSQIGSAIAGAMAQATERANPMASSPSESPRV